MCRVRKFKSALLILPPCVKHEYLTGVLERRPASPGAVERRRRRPEPRVRGELLRWAQAGPHPVGGACDRG